MSAPPIAFITFLNAPPPFQNAFITFLELKDFLLRSGGFAAAPDVAPPIFFNSGMMLITPSEERHSDLLAKTRTLPSYDDGDQGYLNAYFGQEWRRLPYAYNFMKSKTGNPDAFYWILDNKWETIKVVHMVGVKPWRCTSKRDCGGFPERVIPRLWALWWDAFMVILSITSLPSQPLNSKVFMAIIPRYTFLPPLWMRLVHLLINNLVRQPVFTYTIHPCQVSANKVIDVLDLLAPPCKQDMCEAKKHIIMCHSPIDYQYPSSVHEAARAAR